MSNKLGDIARSWWGVVVIGFLSGVIVFQQWQITHSHRPPTLRVGEHLGQVRFLTLDKRPKDLSWDGKGTILYIFSPDCVWCKRNLTSMHALVADTAGRYRFVGVSLKDDGLAKYARDNNLQYPILLAQADSSAHKQLKLGPTPETIVVSRAGVVENVWFGVYQGRVQKEIETTFALHLSPGSPPQGIPAEQRVAR